jgi:hypothetical protein
MLPHERREKGGIRLFMSPHIQQDKVSFALLLKSLNFLFEKFPTPSQDEVTRMT